MTTETTGDIMLLWDFFGEWLDGLDQALWQAHECLAEQQASTYIELGPDFVYQTHPAHLWIAELGADRRLAWKAFENVFPLVDQPAKPTDLPCPCCGTDPCQAPF